jgi:hypothetical protein
MTFGIIAAIVGAVSVAGAAYGAVQQRKGLKEQRSALAAAEAEDARQAAAAETSAAVAANQQIAETKRRRRSSSLLGSFDDGPLNTSLGGAPSVLAAGSTGPIPSRSSAANAPAFSPAGVSASSPLGAGVAPRAGGGGGSRSALRKAVP